jgi:hypothetical protein
MMKFMMQLLSFLEVLANQMELHQQKNYQMKKL